MFVEVLQDIAEKVEFRFGFVAATLDGDGIERGVVVVEGDLLHGLFFDAVAVHVNGFEDAGGEVVFFG